MAALQRLLRSDVDGQLADDAAAATAQTTLRVRRRDQSFASLPEGFLSYTDSNGMSTSRDISVEITAPFLDSPTS